MYGLHWNGLKIRFPYQYVNEDGKAYYHSELGKYQGKGLCLINVRK